MTFSEANKLLAIAKRKLPGRTLDIYRVLGEHVVGCNIGKSYNRECINIILSEEDIIDHQ